MVFEATSRTTGSQVPQTQSLVPRTRKSVVSVGWENNVADEMGVSIQTFLGDTVVELITCKVPHDQRFVYKKTNNRINIWQFSPCLLFSPAYGREQRERRPIVLTSWTRQDHIRVDGIGRDLCDPSIVSTKGTTKLHCFGHLERFGSKLKEFSEKNTKNRRTSRVQFGATEKRDMRIRRGSACIRVWG